MLSMSIPPLPPAARWPCSACSGAAVLRHRMQRTITDIKEKIISKNKKLRTQTTGTAAEPPPPTRKAGRIQARKNPSAAAKAQGPRRASGCAAAMWVREKVSKFITSAASTKYPTRRCAHPAAARSIALQACRTIDWPLHNSRSPPALSAAAFPRRRFHRHARCGQARKRRPLPSAPLPRPSPRLQSSANSPPPPRRQHPRVSLSTTPQRWLLQRTSPLMLWES